MKVYVSVQNTFRIACAVLLLSFTSHLFCFSSISTEFIPPITLGAWMTKKRSLLIFTYFLGFLGAGVLWKLQQQTSKYIKPSDLGGQLVL